MPRPELIEGPGQVTVTEALNLVLCQIERDPDASTLIVTLRRLAVICAGRQDGPELLAGFSDAYHSELCDVRYRRQLEVVLRGRN